MRGPLAAFSAEVTGLKETLPARPLAGVSAPSRPTLGFLSKLELSLSPYRALPNLLAIVAYVLLAQKLQSEHR
jgi:hypothetical protein